MTIGRSFICPKLNKSRPHGIYKITFDDKNKILTVYYFVLWKNTIKISYSNLHVECLKIKQVKTPFAVAKIQSCVIRHSVIAMSELKAGPRCRTIASCGR